VVFSGACEYFRTGSFAAGVALVGAIGKLADSANHHPDVDLRYSGVTVRLMTNDVDGLSGRYVELARQISVAARELGVPADPAAVQDVQVAIDVIVVGPEVIPFWRAVLGYRQIGTCDIAAKLSPRWAPRARDEAFTIRLWNRCGDLQLELLYVKECSTSKNGRPVVGTHTSMCSLRSDAGDSRPPHCHGSLNLAHRQRPRPVGSQEAAEQRPLNNGVRLAGPRIPAGGIPAGGVVALAATISR
jgi:pterin-4a-carbinolamine dehydratase